MDIRQIKALAQILQTSDLTALEIEEGDTKIRLERNPVTQIVAQPVVQPVSNVTPTIAQNTENSCVVEKNEIKAGNDIKSPMVGVYYASSSPDSEPFVKVGSHIKKGDVICIIEAMKLMNEIQAEKDGEIIEIYVNDGQVVEYGQPLFKIAE